MHRSEGQSDYALDLIDLLQQKSEEFNSQAPKDFKFMLQLRPKGEDVEVTNGYKTAVCHRFLSARRHLYSCVEQSHGAGL